MDVLAPTRAARSWRDDVATNYHDLQVRLADVVDEDEDPEEFI